MVRLTDRPDMTLDVYRGRKTTIQQYNNMVPKVFEPLKLYCIHMQLSVHTYRMLPAVAAVVSSHIALGLMQDVCDLCRLDCMNRIILHVFRELS